MKAIDVANHFIRFSLMNGNTVDNLKIQKLLYYTFGYFYAKFDKKLFEEDIIAWPYGPVVIDVYEKFKLYGSKDIHSVYREILDLGDEIVWNTDEPKLEWEFDSNEIAFINQLTSNLITFSGIQLSNASHDVNGPWFKTYSRSPRQRIDPIEIKKYFSNLLEASNKHGKTT